jgi:hypothetical protein
LEVSRDYTSYRSFATGPSLSIRVAKVLRHVLEQGSIPVDKQDDITVADDSNTDLEETKETCYVEDGYTNLGTYGQSTQGDIYISTSSARLHEKQVSLSIH